MNLSVPCPKQQWQRVATDEVCPGLGVPYVDDPN